MIAFTVPYGPLTKDLRGLLSCMLATLLLLCFALNASGFAKNPVPIGKYVPTCNINEHVTLYADPANRLSIEDFKGPLKAAELPADGYSLGARAGSVWATFTLVNNGQHRITAIVEQDYPATDSVDLWYMDSAEEWVYQQSGELTAAAKRPIMHRLFLFPVVVEPASKTQVVVRYRTEGVINIGLSVGAKNRYFIDQQGAELLQGFYFGGILVLIIYNCILFLAVRDRAYIHYLLFAICYGAFMAMHRGYLSVLLWPEESPGYESRILLFLALLSNILLVGFSRRVSQSRSFAPRTDRVSALIEAIGILLVCAIPVTDFGLITRVYGVYTLCAVIIGVANGVVAYRNGLTAGSYLLVAWIMLFLATVVYVFKTIGQLPHNPLLESAYQVGSLIEMLMMSLALAAYFREVQNVGYSDSLSTLGNRRKFNEQFPEEFEAAIKRKQPFSLILLDIDHFKKVNDTWGHDVGDDVLRTVGGILNANTRRPHFACRYGGEEFAITLSNTTEEKALRVAERLRELIESADTNGLQVTSSFGVASTESESAHNAVDLIEAADKALYAAKVAGRNRVMRFSLLPVEEPDADSISV